MTQKQVRLLNQHWELHKSPQQVRGVLHKSFLQGNWQVLNLGLHRILRQVHLLIQHWVRHMSFQQGSWQAQNLVLHRIRMQLMLVLHKSLQLVRLLIQHLVLHKILLQMPRVLHMNRQLTLVQNFVEIHKNLRQVQLQAIHMNHQRAELRLLLLEENHSCQRQLMLGENHSCQMQVLLEGNHNCQMQLLLEEIHKSLVLAKLIHNLVVIQKMIRRLRAILMMKEQKLIHKLTVAIPMKILLNIVDTRRQVGRSGLHIPPYENIKLVEKNTTAFKKLIKGLIHT
jgi:hypothetical protein